MDGYDFVWKLFEYGFIWIFGLFYGDYFVPFLGFS